MKAKLTCLGLMAVLASGGCAAESEGLLTVKLAELPTERIASGEVSGPQEVGGLACRVFKPGPACAFDVDRWWGKTVQPAQGKFYLATVRYKDAIDEPARFLSYAGLGRYEGPSEMHRFGGSGDGKWKLARIPLSWDMVLSLPSQKGRVRLAIQTPGDLPVAWVAVAVADADAERRYNAETREWIRRAQSKLRPTKPVTAQRAVIPPALAGEAIVPYVRTWMSVIYPYSAPQAGQAGATLRAQMSLNEYEPAPFGVYANGGKLTNVTFQVGELRGPAGVLAAEITKGTLEYALNAAGRKETRKIHAQRIWPMYPVDIEKNSSHWFWITLKTDPAKTKPGTYKGPVTVVADQGKAVLPMEVKVLPVKLVTMDEAGLEFGGCTPGLFPEHEMPVMQAHNFTISNIWYGAVGPRLTIRDGKMELDFEWLDHWMAIARKHGMGPMVWFIGGDPHDYPRTLSIEREIYIALHDGEKPFRELYSEFTRVAGLKENRGRTLKEVEPYYRQWVAEVWKHAKANDWPELIFTPFDEPACWTRPRRTEATAATKWVLGPGDWVRDHFKFACKLIHDSAPGSRIYASIHHNRLRPDRPGRPIKEGEIFLPDIEVFCTNAIDEDPKLGEKVRAAGKVFWQYTGIGGGDRPDQGRSNYGFYFAAFDSRGGLLWAYDWGRGFDTSSGTSWMIAWRTPFDVICSPYMKGIREGWDDRRVIETYRKKFAGDAKTMAVLENILANVRKGARPQSRQWRDTLLDKLTEAEERQ